MNESLLKSLTQSAADFQTIVWPAVSAHPLIGGGELRPVEAVASADFKDDLDLLAGIDAWQIIRDRQSIRGIASRVQWGRDHASFTVRYSLASGRPTEYAKRLDAILNKSQGYLFPHLTVQAFLDAPGGRVLSVGAIPTEALILRIHKLLGWGRLTGPGDSRYGVQQLANGTEFIYISWNYLQNTDLRDALHVHRPR